MKIYLDDDRQAPKGWKQTYTANDTIVLLMLNDVDEISLDHDLGDDGKFGTGYDVLLWIEKQVYFKNYIPPKIHVHTANSSVRPKMEAAVRKIKDIYETKSRR